MSAEMGIFALAAIKRVEAELDALAAALAEAERERAELREIAKRFVSKYEGNKADWQRCTAARRAFDEFRNALAVVRVPPEPPETSE
jgi:hypothetical protein